MTRKLTWPRRGRRGPILALVAIAIVALFAGAITGASSSGPSLPGAARDEPTRLVGCTPGIEGLVSEGPKAGRRVAITFDDGPSDHTERVLRALRRSDAKATFFVVGREIPGREEVLRRIVDEGHEIGNHSVLHDPLPTARELRAANRLIERAAGFRPCHFRPPGGRWDDRLVTRAARLGMTTVTWSVETRDWADQSPAAIRASVLEATEAGSIVLMHDGGGDRSGTARVASRVIAELTRRGYELVTVTELLGGRIEVEPG